MAVSRHVIKSFLLIFLTISALHKPSTAVTAADDDDDGRDESPPQRRVPTQSPMDRVMDSVHDQAAEMLDGAADQTSVLNRLKPGVAAKGLVAGGVRNTENKLTGEDALGRLQETKGRTVIAAKKVVDETLHKLRSTVDEIKHVISGDDQDDAGGDRRMSNALDSLLRAVGTESKAALQYASDVINETADRAKVAVEKAQQQNLQRRQL